MTPKPARSGRHSETLRLEAGVTPSDNVTTIASAPHVPPSAGWIIRREIARGGMGIVYLAFDPALNRFLAVKRLVVEGTLRNAMRARFLREARAMAALNHIYICRIYAVGEDAAGPFIAMEYVSGPDPAPSRDEPAPPYSLETLLDRNGAMDQEQTLKLIGKIAAAVGYAHRRGVIHRDLKPANVLFDEHAEPRVVDFGLAALLHSTDARLTMTGDKLLSLGYGAPEQEQDAARVDQRADVYALGGLVYFCLTGENPRFYRDHRVPAVFREPLLQALEQNRDQRWPSIESFMNALSSAVANDNAPPTTTRDGWVCKWCQTMNALAERYCAKCRWDGLSLCPHCDEPTRFGIRHCPACGADIRAFEDADGLLDLLRDLRHQKQFERLLERARRADGLRARGAISENTYRQIDELRQSAAWALQRKDALRMDIAAESASENFERVRELLNEYDVIDNGDTYGDLRARLPEMIAGRHVAKLHQRLQTARTFMAQKKLDSCRAMMAALRDQQQWVESMADVATWPPSGAPETVTADANSGTPDDPVTVRALCGVAIDQLEHALAAEEARILAWQAEADEAFGNQDYDHCIRLCREVELLTVEPTPATALLARATEASHTIDRMLKTAEQALADHQWKQAGDIARRLLTQWKGNHAGAHRILNSVARRERIHRLQWSALLSVLAFLLYILLLPPILSRRGTDPPAPAEDSIFFRPVARLYTATPLRHYIRFWNLPVTME